MGDLGVGTETINALVKEIADGKLILPEIQRGYVWNRSQVRDLLDSLYRSYPIGAILVWQTDIPAPGHAVGSETLSKATGTTNFLLDGQQRLTSLLRVTRGDVDIRFNIDTESFAVADAATKKQPQLWISVTRVFKEGAVAVWMKIGNGSTESLERLNRLEKLKNQSVPVLILKGFDYEETTDIFLRVNSKGTRLRSAELAIAQLAFRLPGFVSDEIREFEEDLDHEGWDFDIRFLMRCLTAVATGQSKYPALAQIGEDEVKSAWKRSQKAVELFLTYLRQNAGIESAVFLPSVNALVGPVAYLARHPSGKTADVDGLLRWFLLASTWGRYGAAAETALDQDLKIIASEAAPFSLLVDRLRQVNGRLHVEAADLDDATSASPFMLTMYLACRRSGATDWWTKAALSTAGLGKSNKIELHHTFPKALISEKYERKDVNELANLAFLCAEPNKLISKTEPRLYLASIEPHLLQKQFVPLDPALWEIDAFPEFLSQRRALISAGINELLGVARPKGGA